VKTFAGYASAGPFTSTTGYVFVGPTTSVVLTAAALRMTGAGVAALGTTTGTSSVQFGLCYQVAGGAITNFVGGSYTIVTIGPQRSLVTATASVALAAGTYNVGTCLSSGNTTAINNNDYVNGWVITSN
jgi:hypothetical protein